MNPGETTGRPDQADGPGARLDPPRARLGTLTALYVTQFLGFGFITIGLSSILRAGGTSLDTLALLNLIGLIWPVKFLWAPILDRYGPRRGGHYRSWLLVLQSGMVLALLALLATDPATGRIGPIVAICAAFVFLSATQDIAADAVAVRLLSERVRGAGNGIQVAASYVGNILGGGACVVVYDRYGWPAAIGLLAGLTAVGLVVVWRFREPDRVARPVDARQAYGALLSVLGQPGCRNWALGVVPLLYVGAGAAYAMVTPSLVDAGWSLQRIGFVTGIVTSVPAVIAGLVAGGLVARIGRAGVLVLGGVSLAGATLLLLPLLTGRAPAGFTTVALCFFMAAYTVANVALYTVNMDYSRPVTGGTDFTVLSSFGLICSYLAGAVALATAARVGYPAVAVAAIVLMVAGVGLGVRHQRRHPRRPETVETVVRVPSEPLHKVPG
ncbi:MFS transporter [Solwaraspora sp. WMMD406]|uniref:MFS transporter n=1 Tax=Solwaraspora sp. WMMD406 TaxID=3016095 RepID=UPI002415B764|nr:MFS transporter [Solwaraspora sp. WMMD406]MDG4765713.1 MFS transporter [Solwaraspora sp. WMMD406]